MIDYTLRKLEELADELLDPYWGRLREWLKKLSPASRVTILLIVGLVTLGTVYWASVSIFCSTAISIAKVATADPSHIPLGASLESKLRRTIGTLSDSLAPNLDKPTSIFPPSAWTLAQLVAADNGKVKIDLVKIRDYFRHTEISCNCWQEKPEKESPPNVAVSGWVLFAMAALDLPATESELKFFVQEQKRDGWWSVFQSTDDESNASTFGTAWALLGLQSQLDRNLVPETMAHDVSEAVQRGAGWLIGHHEDGSRWKDYPFHPGGAVSESISGLVMHALHLTKPKLMMQFDDEWLDALPASVPTASDKSSSHAWIEVRVGDTEQDHYDQITLPWVLIATADAYRAGSYFQRAKALIWLERALDQVSVIRAEKQPDNWWRAELLIALRTLVDNYRPAVPTTR